MSTHKYQVGDVLQDRELHFYPHKVLGHRYATSFGLTEYHIDPIIYPTSTRWVPESDLDGWFLRTSSITAEIYTIGDIFRSPDGSKYEITGFKTNWYLGELRPLNRLVQSRFLVDDEGIKGAGYTLIAGPTFEAQQATLGRISPRIDLGLNKLYPSFTKPSPIPTCECGAKALGVGKGQHGHSSWCGWAP